MKRTTMILTGLAIVAGLLVGFLMPVHADDTTLAANITNVPGDISESMGYDTYTSGRIPASARTLSQGNTYGIDVTFTPGFQLTDGILNGNEHWELIIEGSNIPVLPAGSASVEGWLSNSGTEIPNTRGTVPGTVDQNTGNARFKLDKDFWNGVQNATDAHWNLTYTSGGTWNIAGVKVSIGADNVYTLSGGGPTPGAIPEPATVVSMLLGGAGLAAKRLIRRKKA